MDRPRRTCLVVPGSSVRMLAKARESTADQVILDLEDAVIPAAKQHARTQVVTALEESQWGEKIVSVRANPVSTMVGHDDLAALALSTGQLDTIVLPKVESPADVLSALEYLDDRSAAVEIEALIETARGLMNVEAIAGATDRIATLVFGPLDMSASLGVPALSGDRVHGYPGDIWHYARFRILVAARAVGALAIDGPFVTLGDDAGLREAAERSRAAGYDGMWVIHPSQIDVVTAVFTPSQEELEGARAILAALDASSNDEGRGAVAIGGLMADQASRHVAERIVARGSQEEV